MDEVIDKNAEKISRREEHLRNELANSPALISIDRPASIEAEQYRVLFHRLERARLQRPIKTIVVTSAVSGEGKSVTATNLALVAAAADRRKRVLLVDADLRRPKIGQLFGFNGPGLGEFLCGDATLQNLIRHPNRSTLSVLCAGKRRDDAGRLIAGAAVKELLENVRERFDEIYIDAPPVLAVADGVLLASLSDGTILVVKAGATSRSFVWQALDTLAEANILGCVLNGVTMNELPYINQRGHKIF